MTQSSQFLDSHLVNRPRASWRRVSAGRCVNRPSLVVAVCRFLSNFAVKEELCLTVLHNGGVDALMAAASAVPTPTPRIMIRCKTSSTVWCSPAFAQK